MLMSLMMDWMSRITVKMIMPTHMICGKAAGCTVAFFTTLKPYVWKSAHPSIQSSRMEAIRFANALV